MRTSVTWKTPLKHLGNRRIQPRNAVIVLQINSRGEHACAVRDDLCDVIRWEMLFSRLLNWLLAKVICGLWWHGLLKAKVNRLWTFKSASLSSLRYSAASGKPDLPTWKYNRCHLCIGVERAAVGWNTTGSFFIRAASDCSVQRLWVMSSNRHIHSFSHKNGLKGGVTVLTTMLGSQTDRALLTLL